MGCDISSMNGRPLSRFMNWIRVGHIVHGWLIFAAVIFFYSLASGSDRDEIVWLLLMMVVYGLIVLYYSNSVKLHRRFEPYRKSGMLDDETVMNDGTTRVATLPVFSIVLAIILLLVTAVALIPSVAGVVFISEELGRDVRYSRDFEAWEVLMFALALVSCVSGSCSLVFVSTSIGQRAMKPVGKGLEL